MCVCITTGIGVLNITLIETVNCNSKDELLTRERYYIESIACVNKHIPLRTKKEYTLATKDKKREYDKEYRLNNNEKHKEGKKQYSKENKDKIKEKLSRPFQCECGSLCQSGGRSRHLKSQKHQTFLKQI